jgi:alpha-1,3-glucan synthase
LTRIHVALTLILSQLIGTIAFVLARYTVPDQGGPKELFPNPSINTANVIPTNPIYWIGLISQIVIALGYMFFFRKERLAM